MKWFKNLKIGSKIIFGFLVVSVITGVIGGIGIKNMKDIDDMLNTLYQNELIGLSNLKDANINLIYLHRAEKNAILSETMQERLQYLEDVKKYDTKINEHFNIAAPLLSSDEGKELVIKFTKAWDDYKVIHRQIVGLLEKENLATTRDSAVLSMGLGREKIIIVDNILDQLNEIKEKNAEDYMNSSTKLYESARRIMIILIILGVISGVIIGLYISAIIKKPLFAVVDYAEEMAKLNLTVDLPEEYQVRKDEIGNLAMSFQILGNILRETVAGITKSAQLVAAATEQIGQDNENLSQRTSEQASSLEEIAATIEESNATSKQNSDNANEASKLTKNTLVLAENGGIVVEEAVNSIGEINASSVRIVEIISMINEIAFQTNLLALNAAVEAARAGDQGRGFAVVAGEVRKLAQRSSEAAKEIGVLIKDSVEKIGNGTELVNRSGEALREIIQAVKQVNNLMLEMAAASDEQMRGVEQINSAILEMDSMTQQNAALVEETAAASEEMSSQAQELLAMIQRFNVGSALAGISDYRNYSVRNKKRVSAGIVSDGGNSIMIKSAAVRPEENKGLLESAGYEKF